MRSKSQILSKLRADGHITDKEYKMLEQETCDDAIRRQAVLDKMKERDEELSSICTKDIRGLPPVTLRQKYEDIAKAFQFGMALGFGEKHDEMDRVIDEIKKVITPQPKTGHWIEEIKPDLRGDMWPTNPKCSECGGEPYYINTIYNYKFCPYCGAKMVEPQERSDKE